MRKREIVKQTKVAFDFVQKLYLETSYLIKEVEGLLAEEDEAFVIGKKGGYSVTTIGSTGLETTKVQKWLMRTAATFFVQENDTVSKSGSTSTAFSKTLKIIYLRIDFDGKDQKEPKIHMGVLWNIAPIRAPHRWIKKIEDFMRFVEQNKNKIFGNLPKVDYEDTHMRFQGYLFTRNLFDINSRNDIKKHLILPALEIFRSK